MFVFIGVENILLLKQNEKLHFSIKECTSFINVCVVLVS